jgi:hypothetical protein
MINIKYLSTSSSSIKTAPIPSYQVLSSTTGRSLGMRLYLQYRQ